MMCVIGSCHNDWRVIDDLGMQPEGERRRHHVLAQCKCGTQRVCKYYELTSGRRKRCITCHNKSRSTHGMFGTRVYRTWAGMIGRCTNLTDKDWSKYGGRGIKVCDRWRAFENFYSDMGDRPPRTTLDRIDVDGDYSPQNCRWATVGEQNRNKRNTGLFAGKCLSEWSEDTGISLPALKYRVMVLGMSVEAAIECGPAEKGKRLCERTSA